MADNKPATGANADAKAAAPVANPAPKSAEPEAKQQERQVKASEPHADRRAKPAENAPAPEAPYPGQADLDAIKEGKHRHRRAVRAEGNAASYKTR